MLNLLTVVGARPQFIKSAAISRTILHKYKDRISERIIHTGQHYDSQMSEVFFNELELPEPLYNLGIKSGSHGAQTGTMLEKLDGIFSEERPDGVIVYGDTNSTLAAALSASKMHIPVIHIEAGLRSFNKSMPEEINRIFTDHVSTLLFSPTESGLKNLAKEGIHTGNKAPFSMDNPGVFHTGDIMYDNTLFFSEKAKTSSAILEKLGLNNKSFALATIHRPVNTDNESRLDNILQGLLSIPRELKVEVVISLHPRTAAKLREHSNQQFISKLGPENGIYLIPAVSYLDMIQLESSASMILTDSGGVQKEAWFMKKPVVILRNETEWTEIVESGNGTLADCSSSMILQSAQNYLSKPPAHFPDFYGKGNAAGEIIEILLNNSWF